TPSGLAMKVLTPSASTEHPQLSDTVKVNYTGWTRDGEMFDSSIARGAPASFGVAQVVPGWTEALQLMAPGEKRRLWIPAKLGYGQRPQPGKPAGDLTFDVELLEILKPPPVPEDLKAPPPSAKRAKSGLAYRVLKKGVGTAHPSPTSYVTVNYWAWDKDGK